MTVVKPRSELVGVPLKVCVSGTKVAQEGRFSALNDIPFVPIDVLKVPGSKDQEKEVPTRATGGRWLRIG